MCFQNNKWWRAASVSCPKNFDLWLNIGQRPTKTMTKWWTKFFISANSTQNDNKRPTSSIAYLKTHTWMHTVSIKHQNGFFKGNNTDWWFSGLVMTLCDSIWVGINPEIIMSITCGLRSTNSRFKTMLWIDLFPIHITEYKMQK